MKVLEIGPGLRAQAHDIFKKGEVTTLDIDPSVKADITADARTMPQELYGKFEVVIASHVLQCIEHWNTENVLKEWAKALIPGGEMHILVPSFEWVISEMAKEKPVNGVMFVLYPIVSNHFNLHYAAFTLRKLRANLDNANLHVIQARTGPTPMLIGPEKFIIDQHYVIAKKPKE